MSYTDAPSHTGPKHSDNVILLILTAYQHMVFTYSRSSLLPVHTRLLLLEVLYPPYRGDREPAAPMRAVEEVEFRPADGPGQDSAGADIYLEDCLKIRSTGVDNEDCA